MSVRLRRLQTEHERLKQLFKNHPRISIVETAGDPPDRYTIEYRLKGLVQEKDSIQVRETHRAKILLGPNFPMEMPQCVMLTPVFHPNIDHLAICTEDIGSVGQKVDQIVTFIGEMITYQAYNLQSPRNGEAAKWAGEHAAELPLERVDLTPSILLEGRALQAIAVPVAKAAPAAAKPTQISKAEFCSNCGTRGTDAALQRCSGGHLACPDCILECANCRTLLCVSCELSTCSQCQAVVCNDCRLDCNGCGSTLCPEHFKSCEMCAQSKSADSAANRPSEGAQVAELLNMTASAAPIQREPVQEPFTAGVSQMAQEVHTALQPVVEAASTLPTREATPESTVPLDDPLKVHSTPEPVAIEFAARSTGSDLPSEPAAETTPADPYLVYLAPDTAEEEHPEPEAHPHPPQPAESSPQIAPVVASSAHEPALPETPPPIQDHTPSLPPELELDPYLVYLAPDTAEEEHPEPEAHPHLPEPLALGGTDSEPAVAASSRKPAHPEPPPAVHDLTPSLLAEPELDPYLVYLAPDLSEEEHPEPEAHPRLPGPPALGTGSEPDVAASAHEPAPPIQDHTPSLPLEPELDPYLVYLAPEPSEEEHPEPEAHPHLPQHADPSPQIEPTVAASAHEPAQPIQDHTPSIPNSTPANPYRIYDAPISSLPGRPTFPAESHVPQSLEFSSPFEPALKMTPPEPIRVEPPPPVKKLVPALPAEPESDPYFVFRPADPPLVRESSHLPTPQFPRPFVLPGSAAPFQAPVLPSMQFPAPAQHQVPPPAPPPEPMPTPRRQVPPAPPLPAGTPGFQQVEMIRLGGSSVVAPTAHVGLVVTVRTPQPIRLGQVATLKEAVTVIGRGRVGCFVDDPAVAQFHAAITYQRTREGFGFFLHSTDSVSTWLNDCAAHAVAQLRTGDRIVVGNTELVFFEVALISEGTQ